MRRQLDPELGAVTDLAAEANATVHDLGQPLADREADAGALDRPRFLARSLERLEDLVALVLRDADAVVDHRDPHRAGPRLGANREVTFGLAVLDRIRAEVHQDLREPRTIGDHLRGIRW